MRWPAIDIKNVHISHHFFRAIIGRVACLVLNLGTEQDTKSLAKTFCCQIHGFVDFGLEAFRYIFFLAFP